MVVNPVSTVVVPAVQSPGTTVVVQAAAQQQPATQQTAPQTVVNQTNAATTGSDSGRANSDSEKYDVYLNNGNGTFTLVPLTKTATGFLGPQGEFYTDHPTLEQLNERYMKK